jgi:hypothetical protein
MIVKKHRLFLLFFTLARLTLSGQTQGEVFSWTLALSNDREDPVALTLERPVELRTGDRIMFALTSTADCFVYVIAQDSENSVAILYSNVLRNGQTIGLGPLRITMRTYRPGALRSASCL